MYWRGLYHFQDFLATLWQLAIFAWLTRYHFYRATLYSRIPLGYSYNPTPTPQNTHSGHCITRPLGRELGLSFIRWTWSALVDIIGTTLLVFDFLVKPLKVIWISSIHQILPWVPYAEMNFRDLTTWQAIMLVIPIMANCDPLQCCL